MAEVPADAVAGLLTRWGLPRDARPAAAERGTNNQTFALAVHGEPRWALRISENLSVLQVRAEHRLLSKVGRAGLPFRVPEPVATLDGDTVVETDAGPATLCRWIPGVPPDPADPMLPGRHGLALGLLGQALRDVPASDAPQGWPGDPMRVHPDAPGIDEVCRELAAAGLPSGQLATLRAAARHTAAWWARAVDRLPVQVVHGDLIGSNLLVDPHTHEVTAALDFEIAGASFRVTDLAVALLQSGVLSRPAWQHDTAALLRGYGSVIRLSRDEILALPDLFTCRSAGVVLWRAERWRRGLAQLADVAARLDALEARMSWLAAHADQFLALAERTADS